MTRNTPEIVQLLERVCAGSESATDELLNAHRHRLRQMIAVRLDQRIQTRVDPSDVVQDVLHQATRKLAEYIADCKLPFYPWLRQMAWDRLVELHYQHVRVQKRSVDRELRPSFGLNDDSINLLARNVPSPSLSPSGIAVQAEVHNRVRSAVDMLDDTSREIVLMHYVGQMTLREIASSLEMSESAVKARHIRSLRKLARQIRDEG